MTAVEGLYEEVEALFSQPPEELTKPVNSLRFSMLPTWAVLKRKDQAAEASLDKLYELWETLDTKAAYPGNSDYASWVEARIAIIKATARLDGRTGYMLKRAVHDGSLAQRWRSIWAYLNIK